MSVKYSLDDFLMRLCISFIALKILKPFSSPVFCLLVSSSIFLSLSPHSSTLLQACSHENKN